MFLYAPDGFPGTVQGGLYGFQKAFSPCGGPQSGETTDAWILSAELSGVCSPGGRVCEYLFDVCRNGIAYLRASGGSCMYHSQGSAIQNPILKIMRWLYQGFKNLLSKLLIGLIKLYQVTLSPYIGRACRYTPTCSNYGIEAIQKHGPFKGFWLTLKRVLSCNPWGGSGYDPVPWGFHVFVKNSDSLFLDECLQLIMRNTDLKHFSFFILLFAFFERSVLEAHPVSWMDTKLYDILRLHVIRREGGSYRPFHGSSVLLKCFELIQIPMYVN